MQEYKAILTFGETGTGKSTIQNVLIGQTNIFNVSNSMKSQTKKCQQKKGNLFGDIYKPQIKVIDTPGFLDSSGSDEDTIKYIYEMLVNLKDQGFTIILYCISATNIRCTKGIIDGFKLLQSLLGNEVLSRIFIVVTQLNKLQDQDQKLRCDQISNQLPEVLESAGIEINKDQILYYFHNQQLNGLETLEQSLLQSQTFVPKILQDLRNCYDPDDSQKTLNQLMMNSREMQNLQLRMEYEKEQKILYEQQQQEKQKQMKQALQSDKQKNQQIMEQMKRDHENQKQKLKKHFQVYNDIQNLQSENFCQEQDFDSDKDINIIGQLQPNKRDDTSQTKRKQEQLMSEQYLNKYGSKAGKAQINKKIDVIKMRQLIDYLYESRPRGTISYIFSNFNEVKHNKLIDFGMKVITQEMQHVQEDEKKQKKEFIEYLYDTRPWIFGKEKHDDFIKFLIQDIE